MFVLHVDQDRPIYWMSTGQSEISAFVICPAERCSNQKVTFVKKKKNCAEYNAEKILNVNVRVFQQR